MAWIKARSPGDMRWYLVFRQLEDGSREIFPALADPSADSGWAREESYVEERWSDHKGQITHYHKIEPWPDPPREVEGE